LLCNKKVQSVFTFPNSTFLTLIATFLSLSSEILSQSSREATNHKRLSRRPHYMSFTRITTTDSVSQCAEKMSLNKLTTKYYWTSW